MSSFPVGAKVKATLKLTSLHPELNETWVGEVCREDEFYVWCIDQFGRGPCAWPKASMEIVEIKE